jgi:hypothetical protein
MSIILINKTAIFCDYGHFGDPTGTRPRLSAASAASGWAPGLSGSFGTSASPFRRSNTKQFVFSSRLNPPRHVARQQRSRHMAPAFDSPSQVAQATCSTN